MPSADQVDFLQYKVSRDLLNPNFDGYKLSLESYPSKSVKLPEGIYRPKISQSQYSLLHQHLFVNHNFLIRDIWGGNGKTLESQHNCTQCFIVTESGTIRCIKFYKDSGAFDISVVAQVASQDRLIFSSDANETMRYNATISLPSANFGFASDGRGSLTLYDRTQETWKVLFQESDLLPEAKAFTVVDSVEIMSTSSQANDATLELRCLLKTVVPKESKSTSFQNEFVLLNFYTDRGVWKISRKRVMSVANVVDYSALSRSNATPDLMCMLNSGEIQFSYDSLKPIEATVHKETGSGEIKEMHIKKYTWKQNADEVIVELPIKSSDPTITLLEKSLEVVDNGEVILNGQLFSLVDTNLSKWTVGEKEQILRINFVKQEKGQKWLFVVLGDESGEYQPAKEELEQACDSLMEYTSEEKADPFTSRPAFNAEDLEECDMPSADVFLLTWIDTEHHTTLYNVDLGSHQWLFSSHSDDVHQPPLICLRSDVDGILWRVPSNPRCPASTAGNPPETAHLATFDAFGYVEAGKESRRLVGCSPNAVYAVIADCRRNIYVYWRGTALESQSLRNRKTGRTVQSICKQNLLTLDSADEEILGLAALDDHLLIVTQTTLTAFTFKTKDLL